MVNLITTKQISSVDLQIRLNIGRQLKRTRIADSERFDDTPELDEWYTFFLLDVLRASPRGTKSLVRIKEQTMSEDLIHSGSILVMSGIHSTIIGFSSRATT